MKFENAQQLNAKTPATFYAPDIEVLRASIQPGDFVKVCATAPDTFAERFWIEVTSTEGDSITGTVANELAAHPLEYGDRITVKHEDVYQHAPQRRETND